MVTLATLLKLIMQQCCHNFTVKNYGAFVYVFVLSYKYTVVIYGCPQYVWQSWQPQSINF